VPNDCRGAMVLVPVNVSGLFWGWPHRFQQRMQAHGSEVFVVGPYGGGFTTGIDTAQDLARLPDGYAGGIWTNEVEDIARALGRTPAAGTRRP
jgi:glycerophosphoryl diester phosphodiesterase